jgi:hypothetical protein
MKPRTQWKKGLLILLISKTFLFAVGVLIHEGIHSLTFFVLSGNFGEIHILDTVAYSYHTIAVCIPPQGLVILDTTPFELIAYGTMFLISFCVVFILFKLLFTDYNAKKSEM